MDCFVASLLAMTAFVAAGSRTPTAVIASVAKQSISPRARKPIASFAIAAHSNSVGFGWEGKSMKQPCVYIVASKRHGTVYTGVTSYLPKRAFEHREGLVKGFTAKYGCKILVWYELHDTMLNAITREKQIKAGSRAKKIALIEAVNPDWKDLYDSLI
jgi:putative endonuclease